MISECLHTERFGIQTTTNFYTLFYPLQYGQYYVLFGVTDYDSHFLHDSSALWVTLCIHVNPDSVQAEAENVPPPTHIHVNPVPSKGLNNGLKACRNV